MTKDAILARFKEIGIIYQEPAATAESPASKAFFCNIKKALGYPDILNAIADEIGKMLRPEENCIAASGYGGLPLGAAIASRFNRKLITIRETEKKYGPRGLIDGYTPAKNDVVVVVDDVLTSGTSIRRFLDCLKTTDATTSRAFVVLQREEVELPVPYTFLFSVDEIYHEPS